MRFILNEIKWPSVLKVVNTAELKISIQSI
jgi:hypothetical protein